MSVSMFKPDYAIELLKIITGEVYILYQVTSNPLKTSE